MKFHELGKSPLNTMGSFNLGTVVCVFVCSQESLP